jgi:hypothetical protein
MFADASKSALRLGSLMMENQHIRCRIFSHYLVVKVMELL